MRQSAIGAIAVAAMLVVGAGLVAEEGKPWIDPANCYFCEPYSQAEGLLEAVGFEHHNIANGVVFIMTYTPEWEKAANAAGAEMMKRWGTYDPSAGHTLCGMCEAGQTIPFDKVKVEEIMFNGGEMTLQTTDDAELLAKLHEMTDKTTAAWAAFMETRVKEGHGD